MEASPTRRYVAHTTSSSHHPYRDRHTHPSPSTRKPQPLLHTTLTLARIMLPYLIFICLAALSMGLLNAGGHFTLSAFAPTILNLTLIAILTLFFSPNRLST